jgi:hypothetical protein
MRTFSLLALALGFLAAAAQASDHETSPDFETSPWLPAQGLYWNPDEHGIYYHLSIGPGGYVFVAITHFDETGRPTVNTLQGDYQPTSPAHWADTREIGRLESPLYRIEGGACLGCPYTQARTVVDGDASVEMVFLDDGRARFRMGSIDTALERYPLFTTPSALPARRYAGRWVGVTRIGETLTVSPITVSDVVQGPEDAPGLNYTHLDPAQPVLAATHSSFIRPDLRWGAVNVMPLGRLGVPVPMFRLHDRDGVLEGRPHPSREPGPDIRLFRVDGQRIGTARDIAAWLPSQGLYWNPQQPGILLHVYAGPNGYMFATVGHFSATGEPTFFTLQGPYEPESASQRAHSLLLGRMLSPFVYMREGSCLGCPWRDAVVSVSATDHAELLFDLRGGLELRWNEQTLAFERFPLYTRASDGPESRLAGEWLMIRSIAGSEETALIRLDAPLPPPPEAVDEGWTVGYPIRCIECSPYVRGLLAGDELRVGTDGSLNIHRPGPNRVGRFGRFLIHERDDQLLGQRALPGGSQFEFLQFHRLSD